VHPFDDPDVIAGQGTVGTEILRPIHAVFVAVGGGGLILSSMHPDWNISLFHYRNQAADYGRILVGSLSDHWSSRHRTTERQPRRSNRGRQAGTIAP